MSQEHPEQPGRVPVEELRALVDEWEKFTDVIEWNDYNKGVNEGVGSCAEELDTVLKRYE